MPTRQRLLLIAAGVILCVAVVVWWFGGRGRVTLDFTNAPVAKVLKSIERQTGLRIETNIDPARTISVHLYKAPFMEALDTVATRAEGDVRLAYIAGPTAQAIKDGLAAYVTNSNAGGWTAFGSRGGGGWGGPMGAEAEPGDPRALEWKLSDGADRSLQAFLSQGAQKTGALFAAPSDWNPTLGSLPSSGTTAKMARAIASAAKGKVEEVFLVSDRPRRGGPDDGPGQESSVFAPQRGNFNPEWIADRTEAQIAQLPPDQRAGAQAQFDQMKALWASLQGLTPDQRRAKLEEFMNRPDVQDAMEQRQADRDARNTPEQRENRFRNYIQRKTAQTGPPIKS